MTEKTARGAVIGCGAISTAHLRAMKGADYRIHALCDIDVDRAEKQKKEYGDTETRIYKDYREMLAAGGIDVVAIATPPFLHHEQVVAGLKAGVYVYTEKPVVATLKAFDDIFAAEAASGKKAYVTTSRFRGAEGPMIKQYVDEGDLGDIYRVEATHFRTRGRPGVDKNTEARWFADSRKALSGIMGDMGMYFMDRSLHFTDWPEITSVSAVVLKPFPPDVPDDITYDVEEHVVILARTAGSLTFTFEFANISHHDHINTFKMLGTGGGITVDGGPAGIKYRSEKGEAWRFIEEFSTWKEDKSSDQIIYEQLAEAVRGSGCVTRATTSEQALVLHQIVAMAYRSSKERREISPADLDPEAQIFVPSW